MVTRVHGTFIGATTDDTALRYLFRDATGPVGRDLDARAARVLARARQLTPIRTGLLLTTLRAESGQNATGQYRDVVAGRDGITSYLGYVLFGTSPHQIRPVRRRALRFVSGGRIIFSRRVSHPGTRANNYLLRSLDAAR